eukprot:8867711-Pyramimonas_sp.AAC.1
MAETVEKLQAAPQTPPSPPPQQQAPPDGVPQGAAADEPPDLDMGEADIRATIEAVGVQVDATESEEVVKERFKRFQTSCVEACKRALPMPSVRDESLGSGVAASVSTRPATASVARVSWGDDPIGTRWLPSAPLVRLAGQSSEAEPRAM